MLQLCGDVDLATEPLGPQRGCELRAQHLDGYLAVMPQVLGEVHGGHPARAELALDRVAPGEGLLDTIEAIRYRHLSPSAGAARRTADSRAGRRRPARNAGGPTDPPRLARWRPEGGRPRARGRRARLRSPRDGTWRRQRDTAPTGRRAPGQYAGPRPGRPAGRQGRRASPRRPRCPGIPPRAASPTIPFRRTARATPATAREWLDTRAGSAPPMAARGTSSPLVPPPGGRLQGAHAPGARAPPRSIAAPRCSP